MENIEKKSKQRFLVNLSGIIDILSKHLYSGPHVFIRELLQNSTDAISARHNLGDTQNVFDSNISITLIPNNITEPQSRLVIEDNGTGLTEAEIHQFLAVIGESSKKELIDKQKYDYIGRFGIGLLACFMVSNTICLQTRSIKQKDKVLQWTGNPDGTYEVIEIDQQMDIGTRVILTAKNEGEDYFTDGSLTHWMQYYASYLPYPITLNTPSKSNLRINTSTPPWLWKNQSQSEFVDKAILIGEKYFKGPFFDTITLQTKAGKVKGLGYIVSHATTEHQQQHMIHLKGMRLTKSAQNILPDWAFFVRTIINADDLKPTASREALYEDKTLLEAKKELGEQLINYLINMAENDSDKFEYFVSCHQMALKSLVLDNNYFCLKITPFLKFETNLGYMTLGNYIEKFKHITYVESVDSFRQFAQVSSAKNECLINAGYSYCTDILNLYAHLSKTRIDVLDPQSLVGHLADTDINPALLAEFINKAKHVMSDICPNISVKQFKPEQVPALYISCEKQYFIKSAKINQVESNELWSDIIDTVTKPMESYVFSELCLNANHELITSLIHCNDLSQLQQCLKIIYVQSLLMGHFPLNKNEMDILNTGLISMMTTSLHFQDNKNTQH